MNKMFKISAIAASLLVSGILVGCGSSKSGDNTPAPQPPIKSKIVTVTDDYVIGADIYYKPFVAVNNKIARGNGTLVDNGTSTDNGTPTDNGTSTGGNTDSTSSGNTDNTSNANNKPQYIDVAEYSNSNVYPYKNKDGKEEVGKYEIKDKVNTQSLIISNNGFVDLNRNGKDDTDPKALSMASKATNSYINPFTTLEAFTNLDVVKIFGLEKVDFDTTSDNVDIRKKVAYANAILAEAQYNSLKYETKDSTQPSKPNMNNQDDVLPLSFKSTLEKVAMVVKSNMDNGDDLPTAIAKLTGKDEYKNLGGTYEQVNDFIRNELNRYSGKKSEINGNTNTPSTSTDDVLPL